MKFVSVTPWAFSTSTLAWNGLPRVTGPGLSKIARCGIGPIPTVMGIVIASVSPPLVASSV